MKNSAKTLSVLKYVSLLLFAVAISLAFVAVDVRAATFVVNTTNDTQDAVPNDGFCVDGAGACSLRAAITEANAFAGPDIITLPAGTYTQSLPGADDTNVGGDFDIFSDITINGAGSGTTIIQANALPNTATERVIHIFTGSAAVVVNDVTIQNGNTTGLNGAGIRLGSASVNVTLNRVLVTSNRTTTSGGGISVSTTPATLTIVDSTISNNTSAASGGGMVISIVATVNITGSTITGNAALSATAGTAGGGISQGGATTSTVITNSTISNNLSNVTAGTGNAFSGGLHITGGTANITGTTITGNFARITGGSGLALVGGVYNQQATVTLSNSFVTNNTVSNTVTATSAFHAGIRTLAGTTAATTTLNDSTVSGNTAGGDGGGVVNIPTSTLNSTTNINNSSIFGNTSTGGAGGGVLNSSGSTTATSIGAINIIKSTIRDNNATFGAGIMNQISGGAGVGAATITLNGSTVSGNVATGNGGGIYNVSFSSTTGVATINSTNSTISGNRGVNGGGITNENGAAAFGATSNLNFTTVASNTATASGGGFNSAGTAINLKNSVVADNTATTSGPDIFGVITSQDYNHVENVTGGTFFVEYGGKETGTTSFMPLLNDVTGTDPQLGALANNGGTTNTHLPGISSPVVNTIPNGTNDCGTVVTTSQNTAIRPQNIGCEKGAAERLGPSASNASISGRVTTEGGRGISNAIMSISGGGLTSPRFIRTGSFGYFVFDELPVGETYVITISSKRFVFTNPSRLVTLMDNIGDLDFIADGQ